MSKKKTLLAVHLFREDIKQNDLCSATGIAESEVSRILSGQRRSIRLNRAIRIAEFLKVKVRDIFDFSELTKK